MSYEVLLHRAAQKELGRLPEALVKVLDPVIANLSSDPRPIGAKKLQESLHRIRIGSWRIIYAIFDKEKRIVILRVTKRSERTYKGLPKA